MRLPYSPRFRVQLRSRELGPASEIGGRIHGGTIQASPGLIVAEFQQKRYLRGLALTVCWGRMARTNGRIYEPVLQDTHDALDTCAESISQTDSIQDSRDVLTKKLDWTNVIASKTLHFMCRALGINEDPAAPIENKVILGSVWPGFQIGIPPTQRAAVRDWAGSTFDAYCRYMTAILSGDR